MWALRFTNSNANVHPPESEVRELAARHTRSSRQGKRSENHLRRVREDRNGYLSPDDLGGELDYSPEVLTLTMFVDDHQR